MSTSASGRNADAVAGAIEVFARGFAFTRSFTHPCLAERVGPLYVVRDGPRTREDAYRNEEWIACNVPPAEVDRVARKGTRGKFAVCAIVPSGERDEPLRAAYKALGYRLGRTEPLMVHALATIPKCPSPANVVRVDSDDLAAQLGKVQRAKPLPRQYFAPDSPLRQYAAIVDDQIVGYVRSVVVVGDATWCASMYVSPPHRRRGIARAMLCQMLRDDRTGGAKLAVLLASHTGARLYPVVGYAQIGTLYFLTPRRK